MKKTCHQIMITVGLIYRYIVRKIFNTHKKLMLKIL